MAVTAKLRYLHIAPRKVRLVADLIRGKTVEQAQEILNFTIKRASVPLLKLLKSALANAKNTSIANLDNLYISKITVDEGPKLKRWRPVSRGRAFEIQKKTSHVTLILDEIKKEKGAPSTQIFRKGSQPDKKEKVVAKKSEGEKKELEGGEATISKEKPKIEKPKLKPKFEFGAPKPPHQNKFDAGQAKIEKGIKRFFRRKAF